MSPVLTVTHTQHQQSFCLGFNGRPGFCILYVLCLVFYMSCVLCPICPVSYSIWPLSTVLSVSGSLNFPKGINIVSRYLIICPACVLYPIYILCLISYMSCALHPIRPVSCILYVLCLVSCMSSALYCLYLIFPACVW